MLQKYKNEAGFFILIEGNQYSGMMNNLYSGLQFSSIISKLILVKIILEEISTFKL